MVAMDVSVLTKKHGEPLNSAIKSFLSWDKDNPRAPLIEQEEQLVRLYNLYNMATLKGSPWAVLYMNTILKDSSFRLSHAVSRLAKLQDSAVWKYYSRQERLTYLQEITEMYRLDYREWILLNRAGSGGLLTGLMELVKWEKKIKSTNYKELMAGYLGQVRKIGSADLVIGILSFNGVETTPRMIETIVEGVRKYYGDKKVVIIRVRDKRKGGRAKRVPDAVKIKEGNIYSISFLNLAETSGKGWCIRIVLEMAQQLGAHVLFLGPGLRTEEDRKGRKLGCRPETIKRLYQPLLEGFDYVTPYYINHSGAGAVTNHLCYPLFATIYGKRLRQPMGGEIALSHKFIHMLLRDPEIWFTDIGMKGVDIWITSEALVNGMVIGETPLSANIHSLPAEKQEKMFKQVVGVLFDQIMKNSSWWLTRSTDPIEKGPKIEPVNAISAGYLPAVALDWKAHIKRFKEIFSQKMSDYEKIFTPEVYQELKRLSEMDKEDFVFSSSLWADIVFDFLLEYAFCDPLVKEEFTKEEMLDSIIPIYLAQVASFTQQSKGLGSTEVEGLIQQQVNEFIRRRRDFIGRWQTKASDYSKARSQLHHLTSPEGKRFARLIKEEIDERERKILYLEAIGEGEDRNTFLGEAKRYARILSEIEGREVIVKDIKEWGQQISPFKFTKPHIELPLSPFEEDYLVLTKELAMTHQALKALYISPDTRPVQMSRADITSLPWIEFNDQLVEEVTEDIITQARRQNLQASSPLYFEEKVKRITDLVHKSMEQRFSKYAAYPRLCAEATLIAREVFFELGYYVDTMWTRDLHYFLVVSHEESEIIVDLTSDQFSLNRFSFLALEIELVTSLLREGRREEIDKEKTGKLIEEIAQLDFTAHSLPERDCLMITLQKLKAVSAKENYPLEGELDRILVRLLEIQLIQQIKKKKDSLEDIYRASVVSVDPYLVIRRALKYERPEERRGRLRVGSREYDLSRVENIYVVGAGKVVLGMARALVDILGERITQGILCIPEAEPPDLNLLKKFQLFPAGYPMPNLQTAKGARQMQWLFQRAGKDDMVIALLSGGSSDLMCCPCNGLSLEDIRHAIGLLKAVSADITEINAVIKHLDALKGGKLRMFAREAGHFITLVLSDEPNLGDEPAIFAGGPTIGDESTFSEALEVLRRYSLVDKVSLQVRDFLCRGVAGLVPDNPRFEDPLFAFEKFEYLLVADSDVALDNAYHRAEKLGYRTLIVNEKMSGEVHEAAKSVLAIVKGKIKPLFPQAIIMGGKPTVNLDTVRPGVGGRMSMLATILAHGLAEEKLDNVIILAADTDGIDGNSHIAGGLIDWQTIQKAEDLGLSYADFVRRFDCATFLQRLGQDFKVGNTGTDVGDIIVALIHP